MSLHMYHSRKYMNFLSEDLLPSRRFRLYCIRTSGFQFHHDELLRENLFHHTNIPSQLHHDSNMKSKDCKAACKPKFRHSNQDELLSRDFHNHHKNKKPFQRDLFL